MNKLQLHILCLIVFVLIFTGCSFNPPPPPEDAVYLRVNYKDQAEFNARFGNFIRSQVPELVFEVVPNELAQREDSFADFVQKQGLDIVFMDYGQYVSLVEQELLQPLNLEDVNGLDQIPEELLDSFQYNGAHYGLLTDFQAPAIFYNPLLFEQYGVDSPVHQMTWTEVYELAKQFPVETGFNAFYGGPAEYVLQNIALTLGGEIYTEDMSGLRLDEEPWKQAWLLTSDAYHNQVFKRSQVGFEEFTIGRTAMFYSNAAAIEPMREKSGSTPVEMVTQPVNPDNRDEFPFFSANIFGISENSEHTEQAWQAIKWIDELTFQVPRGNIPSRVKEWEQRYRIDLSAIYQLKPSERDFSIHLKNIAVELSENWNAEWQLYHQPVFEKNLQAAIDGTRTPEQTYQQFVEESEKAWQRYLSRD